MTADRPRTAAALLVAAGFGLLLLAHPALTSRPALWPGIVAAVAAGVGMLYLSSRPWQEQSRGVRSPPLAAGLAYLAAMAASTILGPVQLTPLWVPAGHVALLWVGWWLGADRGARSLLAGAAVLGGAAAGLYGLLQLAGLDPLPPPEEFADRVLSFFANPNHLGDFCAAVLPLAAAGFLWPALGPGHRRSVPRALSVRLAAVAAIYAGLLLAGSRGAYWASGVGAAVLAAGLLADARSGQLTLRWGPPVALLVVALATTGLLHRAPIMTGPAGPVTLAQRLGASAAVLDGGARDATLAHRRFLWRAALEMIRRDPLLGAGYGQFAARLGEVRVDLRQDTLYTSLRPSQQRELTPYAHNEFLHLLAETGLVGLVAFLALLAGAGRSLARALTSASGHGAAWGAAAALTALLIHGLVSYPLHMAVSSYVFWLLLGITFSLQNTSTSDDT